MKAAELAADKLGAALPRRWTHVQAVGTKAAWLGSVVDPRDADLLVSAAWVHDIGYAPDIADTGLHALDGARWLLRNGWDSRLAGLVANHSCACMRRLSVDSTRYSLRSSLESIRPWKTPFGTRT